MRQKLGLILTIVIVIGALLLINSLSYVKEDEKTDTEVSPNRSTYHSGPTGTRALYDLLNESGYGVTRWREVPEKLLTTDNKVETFVIVGDLQIPIKEEEAQDILRWVEKGGRLVLVDRRPEIFLLPASREWIVTTQFLALPTLDVKPSSPEEMTQNVKSITPVQPTALTKSVAEVMPSRFASQINVSAGPARTADSANEKNSAPIANRQTSAMEQLNEVRVSPAPVIDLASEKGAILVDYPHGRGRIVVLSDPYIISNGGIGLRDNLQLALNLVTGTHGLIAFDEFHQGRGITRNAIATYFSGTPVLAIFGQIVLLILLVVWTQGKRFARPLPLPAIDRRSTLEFVASMAEVQQRARAFDLAIENIYSRTRRVLVRFAGLDYNSRRSEIANRVALRSSLTANQIETLMRQCEEAINGKQITERQAILLVKRLREIEASLGLRMRSREVKQASQNI